MKFGLCTKDKIIDLWGGGNAVVVVQIMHSFYIMLQLFSIQSTSLGNSLVCSPG